jgi:uncharacterized protein YkwD
MKLHLYLPLIVILFVLQACSGSLAADPAPTSESNGLIPPLISDEPYDPSLAGAAGAASDNAAVPALCSGAEDSSAASFGTEVIRLVNIERAKKAGLRALTGQAQLTQAAQTHSIDMGCEFFMSHTGSDGSSPLDRILRFGYPYSWWGENVAAGYPTPADVMAAWMNSKPHRDNILNPNFTEIGIGYIYNPGDTEMGYSHYWTMALGRPQ